MPTWNSRGLRGSVFEDLINKTNEIYEENGLCIVQKIPTPITPIEIDKNSHHITLAYFDKKSTVDYIGAVQGIPVCFDAKESKTDTFPIANIHEHQMNFMKKYVKNEGLAFLLIYYSDHEDYYFMTYDEAEGFYLRAKEGGKKSFRRDELNPKYFFKPKEGLFVPYLDMIKLYLDEKA